MAGRSLVWAPKAKQDLQRIGRYYAHMATPDVAEHLLREIVRRAEGLKERPFLGRPRAEVMQGLRSILVSPFSIFYRVSDDAVEIVRILHERRDIPTLMRKGSG